MPGYVLGKKSGAASIALKLDDLGLEATEDERRRLLKRVKELGISKRGPVDDDEFRALHAEVTNG